MEPLTSTIEPPTTDDDAAARRRRAVLARSASAERFAAGPRPTTRGRSHLVAALLTLPGAALWTALTPAGAPRWAVAAFAWGVALMFTASALLHLRRWPTATCERLVRLDHTGIYLAIGGTGVALGLLGFTGLPRTLLLTAAIAGTTVGIVVEWLPFAPPRGFSNAVYLTLGWAPVVLLPWLVAASGWRTALLLLAGGGAYTAGAIVVGLQRPDPVPGHFGYHELFHLLVIVAAATHAAMIVDLVVRLS
ncbi:PAQR family membrane homeostasis protein TrhA [Nitriliruptor alkaliphilus]|uniref:PAQR family membrane homeostasis protein TrhA n=1 Tax=Nitriliruptor alkaliphilus TaxID=427918 RepID=UPI0006989BFC|nr:hemolysin III family protein [Nitriliruptor alkaliphilus]